MKKLFLGIFLSCLAHHVCADTASDALWDKLGAIKSMTASFSQQIHAKQREIARSSGDMSFVRPGKFRWKTQQPMEQLVIADGKKIWIYDVDLEQVTVKKQTESMGSAAGLFLSEDRTHLAHDFHVVSDQQGETEVFNLKAQAKQANIQRVMLRFEGARLDRMDLYDQLGQHTVVDFQHVKTNIALSSKLFQFSPPTGVDVVEQ